MLKTVLGSKGLIEKKIISFFRLEGTIFPFWVKYPVLGGPHATRPGGHKKKKRSGAEIRIKRFEISLVVFFCQ